MTPERQRARSRRRGCSEPRRLLRARCSLGRWGALLALVATLAGCAGKGARLVRPAPETLPPGSPLLSETLDDGDAWLRHHLMFGEYGQALAVVRGSSVAPSDRLLRALQEGLLLHQAGDFERSNERLEWAEVEADLRYTRSVSRGVASLALNDRVIRYTPSAAELVMIPYYRILNYLSLGDRDGALVEAAKANALLARLERDPGDHCRVDAMVLYLAGMVQSHSGERNDGLVSLRQAESAFAGCAGGGAPAEVGRDLYRAARSLGVADVADSVALRYSIAPAPPEGATGDLLLLVEEGFVSHRASQAIHIPIFQDEVDALDGDSSDGVWSVAGRISERLLSDAAYRSAWGGSWNDDRYLQWARALDGAYVLRLAWPVARREAHAPRAIRVIVDDSIAGVHAVGDLSATIERELAAERPAMLARLVARGLTKYLLTRELEQKAEEQGGELLGFLAGRLGNLAANELERADTRSWSLLPGQVSMARLRLPAGTHRVRIETIGEAGAVVAVRDLGEVVVRAGELLLLSERVWGEQE